MLEHVPSEHVDAAHLRPDINVLSSLSAPKGVHAQRDKRRVLHHLPLIERKLEIAERLALASLDGRNPVALEVLEAVAQRRLAPAAAVREIRTFAKHAGSENKLLDDILACYPTGLLELHITDRCDMDCIECHYRTKTQKTVPFGEMEHALARLAPRAITITGGGEPNIYASEGKTFNEVVLELRRVLPGVQLGLINNNSHIPAGEWPNYIAWQRTSVDAATSETFSRLKRRHLFDTVIGNVKSLLRTTPIPQVGVGFLFRPENAHELYAFLEQWHAWIVEQSANVQRRFNVQFRPISPGIEELSRIRAGAVYPDGETHRILSEQASLVRKRMHTEPGFSQFVENNTNFESSFGRHDRAYDTSLFVHFPREFRHCYNSLAHRVLRATGDEYPDFLLCNEPGLSLGNPICGGSDEVLRVALMQFYFFNRLSRYCTSKDCRQGWVSAVVEDNGGPGSLIPEGLPNSYFF